jgi:hypothetical protein
MDRDSRQFYVPRGISTLRHLQAQDFARFALGNDFKRPAANFAIRGEALRRDAGVNDQFHSLAAEGTKDGFSRFHRSEQVRPIAPQSNRVLDGAAAFRIERDR